jgi:hypothetical protein
MWLTPKKKKFAASKALAKLNVVNTCESDLRVIGEEFDRLLASVASIMLEKRDNDELSIMNG